MEINILFYIRTVYIYEDCKQKDTEVGDSVTLAEVGAAAASGGVQMSSVVG
jgi:hypothetical protein